MKIEIIENDDKFEFERDVADFVSRHNTLDIKFAVTPEIHGAGFSSYSSGETYYAMIIYEY